MLAGDQEYRGLYRSFLVAPVMVAVYSISRVSVVRERERSMLIMDKNQEFEQAMKSAIEILEGLHAKKIHIEDRVAIAALLLKNALEKWDAI